ncbi:hypothetical protein A2W24_06655 [Microgenomates group bacterium RBG_16_45_19]|nr:MAG: hypothetical protein A2W24_06655 [Microgenomates group bacterium RBG_16_45_19]
MTRLRWPIISLVLGLCLFLTTQVQAQSQPYTRFTWALTTGLNFISPPLTTNITAAKLCQIHKLLTKIETLPVSSSDLVWQTYSCTQPDAEANFTLLPNVGYLITASRSTSLTLKGTPSAEFPATYPVGYNAIGVSVAEDYGISVDELCGPMVGGNQVAQVDWYQNGQWVSYDCQTLPFIRLPVLKGQGYLIKVLPL